MIRMLAFLHLRRRTMLITLVISPVFGDQITKVPKKCLKKHYGLRFHWIRIKNLLLLWERCSGSVQKLCNSSSTSTGSMRTSLLSRIKSTVPCFILLNELTVMFLKLTATTQAISILTVLRVSRSLTSLMISKS